MTAKSSFRLFRPIGLSDFAVLFAFLSLVALQLHGFAEDPGLGWHLKTGELISHQGSVPRVDPFLFGPERSWVCDQWLSDFLFYLLYFFGSWPLLYASLTCYYLLTYFGVLYFGVKKLSGSALAASVTSFFAFKIGLIHFILRPVMLSFLLFALVYLGSVSLYRKLTALRLETKEALKGNRLEQVPDLIRKSKVFIYFPIIFCLWANLHPSFVLGLVLLSLLPISLFVDTLFFKPASHAYSETNYEASKRLLILVAVCCFATLFNPVGLKLHLSIFSLANSDYFLRFHTEWLSPDFREFAPQLFAASIFLISFSCFVAKRPRWGFFEYGSLVFFALAALQAVRIIPYYGIVAALPLAESLRSLSHAYIFEKFSSFSRIAKAFTRLDAREHRSYHGVVFLSLLVVFLIIAVNKKEVLLFNGEFGPESKDYPLAAMTELKKARRGADRFVVAAPPHWGGYITWAGYPAFRAVIDDRNTLLGEKFYKSFFKRLKPTGDWKEYLDELGATHLLLSSKSAMAREAQKANLEILHKDDLSILFKL